MLQARISFSSILSFTAMQWDKCWGWSIHGFIFTFAFQVRILCKYLFSFGLESFKSLSVKRALFKQFANDLQFKLFWNLSAHRESFHIVSFFPTIIPHRQIFTSDLITVSSCSKVSFVHEKGKSWGLEDKTISQCQCKVPPWELLGRTSICFSLSIFKKLILKKI